jgi:hypothetical protein
MFGRAHLLRSNGLPFEGIVAQSLCRKDSHTLKSYETYVDMADIGIGAQKQAAPSCAVLAMGLTPCSIRDTSTARRCTSYHDFCSILVRVSKY